MKDEVPMIQLALDRLTRQECHKITEQASPYVDYVEIGTGVLKEYGMEIVREMKGRNPDKVIVADMKTCDAGKEAGADITTVMGFAADQTIVDSLNEAREHGKKVMVDLLGITAEKRLQELKELGVQLVSVHIGKDMQHSNALESLNPYMKLSNDFHVFVAGGVKPDRVEKFHQLNPAVYIVGSYITESESPSQATKTIKEVIQSFETNTPSNP
ncbi:3-hexulose-6-phosphate synthase [Pseudalkalibacillus sp. R45]|uniref:3-hexulose-6-phosphate synthase n=1 Tax=Pseudalkalibacillus sp. R45 TaxID=3457433 RepID=UPI003FCE39ED